MAKRSKYSVPEKVRTGRHRRKVSHALGNSPISGYAEELGGAALRRRLLILIAFLAFIAIGVYFVFR